MGKIGVMVRWMPEPERAQAKIEELERAGYVVGERHPDCVWMEIPDTELAPLTPEQEQQLEVLAAVAEGVITFYMSLAVALVVLALFGGTT